MVMAMRRKVTMTAQASVDEDDVRRLEVAGFQPVLRWRRRTEDGHELVFDLPDAVTSATALERRAARRRLRSAR